MDSPAQSPAKPPNTWDLPTRLYHWVLTLLILGAVVSSQIEYQYNPSQSVHRTIGLLILGVIIFRLLWGFFGNRQARFKNFPLFPLRAVKEDIASLRADGKKRHWVGHSPVGSWSTVLLLSLIGLQAVTGLMTEDEIVAFGPLVHYLPSSVVTTATSIHFLLPKFFVPLILIHIVAILWHELAKKNKILKAMFVGYRPKPPEGEALPEEEAERPKLALALLLFAALVCIGLYLLY